MANNLEIEAQRQALVTSIREAAQALRECANKTDTFANYLQNVFPVPQPYSGLSFSHSLQSASLPAAVADGQPVKRRPGRPKKADQDDDAAAADDGAVNGDGKKRKRQTKEKKPKDPNAPKRPPSAYLLYQNHVRKEVQAANPNLPYGEILTYISKAWSQLSDVDKAPYSEATEIAKAEYEKKKSAYEASLKSNEAIKSPADAASVPAHQDTSDDEDIEHPTPAPVTTTAPARVKSPPAARISLLARTTRVVQQDDLSSDDDVDAVDDDDEDDEEVPPPKKKARKSEHPAPAPAPVVVKEKEKEKVKKVMERKERKDRKLRD